jgi:arabinosyltransferase A/arabinosyltransferase B/arabinosyltransferase C
MVSLTEDDQDSDTTRPPADGALVRRWRLVVLVLGALAVISALAFPFAPVRQPLVDYNWSGGDGAAATAVPLMPYQPIALTATVSCTAIGSAGGSRVVLSTVPLVRDPDAPALPGLRIVAVGSRIRVSSYDRLIVEEPAPQGGCAYTVRSDPHRTSVSRDGREIGAVQGDVRPVVAGVFTEVAGHSGLRLSMRADTRNQTPVTPLKLGLGALFLVCLIGVLIAVRIMDRVMRGNTQRLTPSGWWRPRIVDGAVVVGLAVWLFIGPLTVDDGWILSMVRGIHTNGFIGNIYRWMNAPEAPFSWFYEVYNLWSRISMSPLWLRIPSTVIAALIWLLLSRAVLPRLGAFARSRSTLWLAAVLFLVWSLPFNLGVRAEPWVALGVLGVLVAVDRGVASGRVFPLLIGLVIAAMTVTVAPQGLMAFTPFLVMLLPVVRVVRSRLDLRWVPAIAGFVAASAAGLLFAYAHQSYAAVSEANRVRKLIGGGLPWFREIDRYAQLLSPETFQGALQRRLPMLLALFGLGWLAWTFGRRALPGVARETAALVTGTFGLSLVALMFSPTKWTYHFGALAGVGTALLVVAVQAWSRRGIEAAAGQPPGLRVLWILVAGISGMTIIGGIVAGGRNEWPFLSNFGIPWSTVVPHADGRALATLVLGGGALLVTALVVIAVLRTARGQAEPPRLSRFPTPALLALLAVTGTVALQFSTVGYAAAKRRHTYTVARDSINTLRHGSCGLADYLLVEPDPRAGLLAGLVNAGPEGLHGFVASDAAVQMAGVALPGWKSTAARNAAGDGPATATTGWYPLPQVVRAGAVPLVITVTGRLEGSNALTAEFGRINPASVANVATKSFKEVPGAPAARDLRLDVPVTAPGANAVRLTGIYGGTDVSFAFTPPRAPHTERLASLVPNDSAALLDWPVAFVFPCLRMAALRDGAAQLPQWRVGPPRSDDSGGITTDPRFGGPFVTPRMLVRQEQVPVYVVGDMLREVITLYRWVPMTQLAKPAVQRGDETVSGLAHPGRVTVPGVDPVP